MKIEENYDELQDMVYWDIQGELYVGKQVKIEPFSSVICWDKITIEDGTQIASGARIVDFDHDFTSVENVHEKGGSSPIHIGKYCLIGANATILKGVTLGDGCIVGAGAVVTKSFPAGSVIVGNPAKLLRKR